MNKNKIKYSIKCAENVDSMFYFSENDSNKIVWIFISKILDDLPFCANFAYDVNYRKKTWEVYCLHNYITSKIYGVIIKIKWATIT